MFFCIIMEHFFDVGLLLSGGDYRHILLSSAPKTCGNRSTSCCSQQIKQTEFEKKEI